jgi:hypothetical protein
VKVKKAGMERDSKTSRLTVLILIVILAGCGHRNTYADLGDCRFKAQERGENADKSALIESCMASKGYRIDFTLQGCSPDPADPTMTPNPFNGTARFLFHPDPQDDRCYAKEK